MTGTFVSAWVLFPLVLLGVSIGGGLLVRRLGGGWLPTALVVPVGFCLTIALSAIGTSMTWLAPATGWIVVAFALVGFGVEARRGTLRISRPNGISWAALAGFGTFLVFAAPALLTGTTTITGYTRIVDTGFQIDFAKYLVEAGRQFPLNDSSYHDVMQKIIPEGYPGGGQGTLGAIAALVRTDVPWCYQPFIAVAGGMGAVAIYSLLGRVTESRPLRLVGSVIAMQANLLYAYSLEGGIKELTTAAALVTMIAVLAERLPGEVEAPPWTMLPLAVPISAAISSFSFGIAPWVGVLYGGLFVVTLVRGAGRRLRVLRDWVVLALLSLVIALPSLITSIKLASVAGSAIGGVINLGNGNLAYPVPAWPSAGIWMTGDYRYPLAHPTPTRVLDLLVIALAVLGTIYTLHRRRWTVALLGIGTPIALYYWIKHAGVWIGFKSFTITGVFALILAFTGLAALHETRWRAVRALGWVGVLVVSGAVLYGNALTYHDEAIAPAARYADLDAIGQRYAGHGPALYPAFDEFAEYFLRQEQGSDSLNPANGVYTLLPGVPSQGGVEFSLDLNQFAPSFVQSFPLIVEPRAPLASRAPSNYDLAERTKYFNVWRRDRPSSDIVVHLPLAGSPTERTAAFCQGLAVWVSRAGPGASVAFVMPPVTAQALPVTGTRPHYWQVLGDNLRTLGAGSDTMTFSVPSGDVYSLWLRGSVGRPMTFALDGRRLGQLAYEERYPQQWLQIGGDVRIAAGTHTLRVTRGNGSLHPGSGDGTDVVSDLLGPIAVRREDPDAGRVEVAPATNAQQVCHAPVGYQWIEVLRPAAIPPDALHVTS